MSESRDEVASQSQIEGLATLLVLDDELRKLPTVREFGFFVTNETHRLIHYHTAFLWQKKPFPPLAPPTILTQSGTAEIDPTAPINQWLQEKINEWSTSLLAKEIHQVQAPPPESSDTHVVWQDALPSWLLWCPFLNKREEVCGGLLFFRETPFSEAEIKMMRWLIASYEYTWGVMVKERKFHTLHHKVREKKYVYYLLAAIAVVLLFPIKLSVLGTATVVPLDPVLINAPLQGVIKSFAVNPGDTVQPGQLLFTLDQTDLAAEAEVSQKALQLTQEKLRTASSQQLDQSNSDSGARTRAAQTDAQSSIPVLQAQLAVDQAHLDYTSKMLQKTEVKSPIAGVVVFDNREDWLGQPVQTGERILEVADAQKVKLRISLPVSNAISLTRGGDGVFFPTSRLNSLPVRLTSLGYNARLTPAKILAYQLEARFTRADDQPLLGSEGTVRLYGHRVPVIYYLFRLPLQSLRQRFGL